MVMFLGGHVDSACRTMVDYCTLWSVIDDFDNVVRLVEHGEDSLNGRCTRRNKITMVKRSAISPVRVNIDNACQSTMTILYATAA